MSILAANPVAAQQAIRAKAALVIAALCITVTSRAKNAASTLIPSNGTTTTTSLGPQPSAMAPRVNATSFPSAYSSGDIMPSSPPPSFPTALIPALGAIGVDPLLRGHRACIVGNVVFVALFGGVILIVAALRGPVILKSSLRRGLQLVRWPGSLILPATLAVDGALLSAFFLVLAVCPRLP